MRPAPTTGHQIATNTIMVWCTCGAADCDHPDGSRLMALDSWVIEHCRRVPAADRMQIHADMVHVHMHMHMRRRLAHLAVLVRSLVLPSS